MPLALLATTPLAAGARVSTDQLKTGTGARSVGEGEHVAVTDADVLALTLADALADAVTNVLRDAVPLTVVEGVTAALALFDAAKDGEIVVLPETVEVKIGEIVALLLTVVEGTTDELTLTDGPMLLDAVIVSETVPLLLPVPAGLTPPL